MTASDADGARRRQVVDPHRRVRARGSPPRCARSRTPGFYCVDNLPIVFLEKLLELSGHTAGEVSRIALVVDAREGRFLADAPRVIQEIRAAGRRRRGALPRRLRRVARAPLLRDPPAPPARRRGGTVPGRHRRGARARSRA